MLGSHAVLRVDVDGPTRASVFREPYQARDVNHTELHTWQREGRAERGLDAALIHLLTPTPTEVFDTRFPEKKLTMQINYTAATDFATIRFAYANNASRLRATNAGSVC